jgi:hypothetical protein
MPQHWSYCSSACGLPIGGRQRTCNPGANASTGSCFPFERALPRYRLRRSSPVKGRSIRHDNALFGTSTIRLRVSRARQYTDASNIRAGRYHSRQRYRGDARFLGLPASGAKGTRARDPRIILPSAGPVQALMSTWGTATLTDELQFV